MQYTKLGNTGTTVSRICMGCMSYGGGPQPSWAIQRDWAVGAEEAEEHFRIALDAGVNFFDTANTYSVGASEQITGRWLKQMAVRDQVVVATKVHWSARVPISGGSAASTLSRLAKIRCAA